MTGNEIEELDIRHSLKTLYGKVDDTDRTLSVVAQQLSDIEHKGKPSLSQLYQYADRIDQLIADIDTYGRRIKRCEDRLAFLTGGRASRAKSRRFDLDAPAVLLGLPTQELTQYYFAYGSNMYEPRVNARMPRAVVVGKATLHGYRVAERLYADIDRSRGRIVEGVLYRVSGLDLDTLDRYEGAPRIYRRIPVKVYQGGSSVKCWTYQLTDAARAARDGQPYPEPYRAICSSGAMAHGVKNAFLKEAK